MGPQSRDFSSFDGLDMYGPTIHDVSFSSVYQPYLKHANVYCELCSSIMTTYFYMHDDACALVPRVNRRACQRLLKDLTRNPFFREIVGVAPGTRPEDDDTTPRPPAYINLTVVDADATARPSDEDKSQSSAPIADGRNENEDANRFPFSHRERGRDEDDGDMSMFLEEVPQNTWGAPQQFQTSANGPELGDDEDRTSGNTMSDQSYRGSPRVRRLNSRSTMPPSLENNAAPRKVTMSNATFEEIIDIVGTNLSSDLLSNATKKLLVSAMGVMGLPDNDGELVNADPRDVFAVSDTDEDLLFGCIDKTMEGHPLQHGPGQCPSIVACNILENEAGAPLCGNYARQWGDFLPNFTAPLKRPHVPDTLPFSHEFQKPALKRFPLSGNFMDAERPYCQFCIDAVNTANALKGQVSTSSQLCTAVPDNLQWECENWVHDFWENPGLPYALRWGCVDASDRAYPIESGPFTCPGPVACNILIDPSTGGPFCGLRPGDIGTSLYGNVWVDGGKIEPLQPLDQHSMNKYLAFAIQEKMISNVMATHDSAFQKLRENATLIALLKSAFVKDLSAKSRAEKIKQNEEEAKQRLEQRLAEIDKDGNGISDEAEELMQRQKRQRFSRAQQAAQLLRAQ